MRYTDIVRTVVRNAREKDIPALTWDEQKFHINAIRQKIDEIEIVVRCKDCKYGEKRIGGYRCRMLDEDWDMRFIPMHFCSCGERK